MKTIRQRPVSDFYLVFLYAFFLLIIQVIIKVISWKKAVQGLYFLKKATDKTPIIINWSKLATSVFCYLDSQYSDEICTWVLDILDELDYYDDNCSNFFELRVTGTERLRTHWSVCVFQMFSLRQAVASQNVRNFACELTFSKKRLFILYIYLGAALYL